MKNDGLGQKLKSERRRCELGSLPEAGKRLSVSQNTLGAYERGDSLPDLEFLADFAALTGTDFNELLRLRLAASPKESARALAGSARLDLPAAPAQTQSQSALEVREPPAIYGDGGRGILEAVLRMGEYRIRNNEVTPQVIEAGLSGADSWIEAAKAFPDLDLRMRNMIAVLEFMKAAGVP